LNAGSSQKIREPNCAIAQETPLSQQHFAQECGFDKGYIRAVERGEKNITLLVIQRIASTLNIPLVELFKSM
jgi:transcriptional regulator with XRE-family HTH domain